MAGLDFSQPLLGAGAQAKSDWGAASARTSLDFTGGAQFRRGVKLEIGVEALASADAQFQQFIAAMVRGNAFAEAHAKLQLQLPLNIFDEAGLSIGAEAAAQAAAGIEVGLGLSVGDFVRLAKADPQMAGLPVYLLIILLEEVSLGGKFEVHVAAAAMAYASIKITGSVISRPGRPAGFDYTVDAGLGAAAGVGFSGGLAMGFKNFRRFYGRAVDAVVDETIDALSERLPASQPALRQGLMAFAPVAKTALRVAYEIGDYIANNNPGRSSRDAANLANHCTGIVLEEAQRFVFDQFIRAGLGQLDAFLRAGGNAFQQAWNQSVAERNALADALVQVPAEPFVFSADNAAFWKRVTESAVALIAKLPNAADLLPPVTCLYAAVDLLLETARTKIEQASSYAMAVGAGGVQSTLPFDSQLAKQPAPAIRAHINQMLGRAATVRIDRADFIRYLTHATAIAALRRSVPEVDAFFRVFKGPIAQTEEAVCQLLLGNRAAFVSGANGPDPRESLRLLLTALDTFVSATVKNQLAPAIVQHIAEPEQRMYFNEVLVPAVTFVKDVAFDAVLNWDRRPVDKAAFTEALGSVLMLLLGRTLVIGADAFMTGMQQEMKTACAHAAGNLEGRKSPFAAMGIQPDAATLDLFRATLEIGGEVFGPLPTGARRRLRNVLYQVFETLPPGRQADFLTDLGDQFFIPNRADLDEVGRELLSISSARFNLLAGLLFEKFGNWLAEVIEQLIAELQAALLEWERQLELALARIVALLQRLERELQAAIAATQDAFDDATRKLHETVTALQRNTLRDRIRDKIVDTFEEDALDLLRDNPVYKNLPFAEVKKMARDAVKVAVRGLVGPALVGPVLDAIGEIAAHLAPLTGDLDRLDPRSPLAPQILDLILGELDARLNALSPPSINVGFSISFDFGGRQTVSFSLGRIALPRSNFKSIARAAIRGLDFYESKLNAAATATKAWFEAAAEEQQARIAHARTDADHRRLAAINSEHTATPKQIRIVVPTSQGRVTALNATARIELTGTPASYLGLVGDAQARVIVLLNGAQLSLVQATVSTVAPAAGSRVPTLSVSLPLPAGGLIRGANGLTVLVLDRGGRVVRQQTTFSYAPLASGLGPLTPIGTIAPVAARRGAAAAATAATRTPVALTELPVGLGAIRANVTAAKKGLGDEAKAKASGLAKIAPRGGR